MTSILSRGAMARLRRDLQQLQKQPLAGTAAEPTEDNFGVWNGCIHVPVDVDGTCRVAPLHLRIVFPSDYPNSAPNAGFTTDFEYSMGASYFESTGPLKGCKVVCLDLLGNFGNIHTEWKSQEGTGWSPSYSVSTLLLCLQQLICEMGSRMSVTGRRQLLSRATEYARQNPDDVPEVPTAADVAVLRREESLQRRLAPLLGDTSAALEFAKRAEFLHKPELVEEFISLFENALDTGAVEGSAAKRRAVEVVDTNIVCYNTGKLYTETILGYGISVQKRGRQVNLSTPAELLSLDAFRGGLRQSTTKVGFTYFLPAFINPKHSTQSKQWVQELSASVRSLGVLYSDMSVLAPLSVFPKLINTMLAEIMSPETSKSAAIAYFEALLSFWRTFHFLLKSDARLLKECQTRLRRFVTEENFRLKSVTPDVGALFAMYACCPSGAPPYADFIAAYVDEAYIRSALYWTRNSTPLESAALFAATEVGRNIAMFQSIFVHKLIGPEPAKVALLMDASNGKLPEKLAELQGLWRRYLTDTKTWPSYFQKLGLHGKVGKPICADIAAWARRCVSRGQARGSAYTGRGNTGRGNGGGRRGGHQGGRGGYRGGNRGGNRGGYGRGRY